MTLRKAPEPQSATKITLKGSGAGARTPQSPTTQQVVRAAIEVRVQ
jgi:hypothetical protein